MKPITMKTEPTDAPSSNPSSGESDAPTEQTQDIQADLTQRVAASAARIGEVLGKSIELTEAGMTMGLKLFNLGGERLLSAVASKIVPAADKVVATAGQDTRSADGMADEPAPSGPVIGNALQIVPGGQVHIPFSISNDTIDKEKQIRIEVGDLAGERTGRMLDHTSFSVTPAEKTVGPMDFEKFVFEGTIAPDIPPDRYVGLIEVTGDEQFTIQAIISVESAEPVHS